MLADLERLIELQAIETRAADAARVMAEAPGRIAALDALLHAATDEVDTAKHALAESQTARRTIDKDLAVVQQRQGKYKDQLMEVKTNHEYHAMQHQIAAAAEEVGRYEEQILINMLEADEISARLKRAEAALKAAHAKVSADRGAIEQQVAAQQAVLTACDAARATVVAGMDDAGRIDTFNRIAKVRGTAVARAVGERCTVCQVRLRPAVFVSVVRNDQIVQCDSCQRILYFIPPKPADEASAPPAP